MAKENTPLIDMHNRISATQLEKVLKMQLKTLAEHPELAHVLPPLMVWGARQVGKTYLIEDLFAKAFYSDKYRWDKEWLVNARKACFFRFYE